MTIDRSAIMRDAHKRFRDGKRLGLGWDFARCLRQAWFAAKHKQQFPRKRYQPTEWPTYQSGLAAYLEITGGLY